MARGMTVAGASSLGALRAAELDHFGMCAVGRVATLVKTEVITDDADVAVLHAPEELGFRPLTIALPDILVTLRSLVLRGRLSQPAAAGLASAARALHYTERQFETVARAAKQDETAELLIRSHVEVKRLDALQLCAEIPGLVSDPVRAVMPPLSVTLRQDLAAAGYDLTDET